MPKSFAQLNYYEMLDIRPDATAFDIRHAYSAALQLYQPGSLASYSFFSGDERQSILSLIEKAYATLIHEQARKDYDEELIRRGELVAEQTVSVAVKKPVSIFDISRSQSSGLFLSNSEALKSKISQSPLIGDILTQNELCGADLKKIRTELGVSMEQIAQETKIRHDHLQSIEEDHAARLPEPVFLKGFVKSYLKILCLEPVEELSTRYMTTVSLLPHK